VINIIPLPDLPRALAAQGISTPYVTLWRHVVAGSIPAHRHGGRWVINPADLPGIARFFTESR